MTETSENLGDAYAVKEARDYFRRPASDPAGIHFRLDAGDVIESVRDALLGGGVYNRATGEMEYREENRLMSDEGISRVILFLRGSVNKISHLTKFESMFRILLQVRAMSEAYLKELTLNMKRWGPTLSDEKLGFATQSFKDDRLYIVREDELTVTYKSKVRNKNLIMHVVENAMLVSLQRGIAGFEAENLQKSWLIQESIAKGERDDREGRSLKNLFMRGRGGVSEYQ